MQSLFYGVGAAVIGIIARSVQKLAKLTLSGPVLWVIFWVVDVTTTRAQREIVWLFLLAGFVTSGLSWHAASGATAATSMAPSAIALLAPASSALHPAPSTSSIFWLLAKAGAFVFGRSPVVTGTAVRLSCSGRDTTAVALLSSTDN